MNASNEQETKSELSELRRVVRVLCLILAGAAPLLTLVPSRTTAQAGGAPKAEKAAGKRLNHIDLVVPHVKEDRAFFEKYFGLRCLVDRGDKMAVMTDGHGFGFVLSSPETGAEIYQLQGNTKTEPSDKAPGNADAKKPIEYPVGFHIGFMQDNREAVNEIHKKLTDGGVSAEKPQEYHGAWTFFVRAPGGYFVEVFHQPQAARLQDGEKP